MCKTLAPVRIVSSCGSCGWGWNNALGKVGVVIIYTPRVCLKKVVFSPTASLLDCLVVAQFRVDAYVASVEEKLDLQRQVDSINVANIERPASW